jgi:hypothetical protein
MDEVFLRKCVVNILVKEKKFWGYILKNNMEFLKKLGRVNSVSFVRCNSKIKITYFNIWVNFTIVRHNTNAKSVLWDSKNLIHCKNISTGFMHVVATTMKILSKMNNH